MQRQNKWKLYKTVRNFMPKDNLNTFEKNEKNFVVIKIVVLQLVLRAAKTCCGLKYPRI